MELALLNIPMIIMYKLSFISFFIMKSLVKIKYIGLVNLILGKSLGQRPIVKEFIQPDYNDEVQIMVELQKLSKMKVIENILKVAMMKYVVLLNLVQLKIYRT